MSQPNVLIMNIMRITSIFIFSIILILLLFSSPVIADHSTCTTSTHQYIDYEGCDDNVNWDEIFNSISMGGSDTLADSRYEKQRLLFNQIRPILNSDTEKSLVSDNLHSYEIHSSIVDARISSGLNNEISYNRDSINSESNSNSENDFVPNVIGFDAYIPQDTTVSVIIYDDEDNPIDNHVFYPDDVNTDEESRYSTEIDVDYHSSYEVEVRLTRESVDTESPIVSNEIVLKERAPSYRFDAGPRNVYDINLIGSFNDQMYDNYENIHNSNYDTVISPSYPAEKYEQKIVNDDIYSGGLLNLGDEGRPIRDSYISLDKIEPSVKAPSGEIGQDWDMKIDEKGSLYITYDSSVGEIPPDGQDYLLSSSDGDRRWDYSHSESEYTLIVESTNSFGQSRQIDSKTTSDTGVFKVDYDEDDLVAYVNSLEVTMIKDLTFEQSIDEAYSYRVPNPMGNGTVPRCCRWDNNVDSEDHTFSHTVHDNISIDVDSNEGPDNEDFDIQVGIFSDESRTHVDRKLDNGYEETRWTNIEATSIIRHGSEKLDLNLGLTDNTVRIPVGEKYTIYDNKEQNPTIDRQITDDMDVHLNVWAHGNFGTDTEVETYIESEKIGDSTININERNDREKIIDNREITEYVIGESQIEMNNIINGDTTNIDYNPYITYALIINVDEPISQINSRYKYWTFRNSKWDNIDEIEEDCSEDSLGDAGCFELAYKQITPSGAMPVQAHLLPSSQQIGSPNSNQQLGYNIENVQYSDMDDGFDANLANSLITPIKSSYCPKHVRHTDDDDNYERVCSVYSGYLADYYLERAYNQDGFTVEDDIDSPSHIPGIDLDNLHISRSVPALIYEDNDNISVSYDQLDYRPLLDNEQYYFEEEKAFEIVSDSPESDYQVAGNTSWNHKDVDTDEIRITTDTKINLNTISREELTDEYVNEIKDDIPENNDLKTEEEIIERQEYLEGIGYHAEVRQLKLELTDEFNAPIDTTEKDNSDVNISIKYDGELRVFSTQKNIDTNEDGIAYTTVEISENLDEEYGSSMYYKYNTTQNWWDTPTDERILQSTEGSIDVNFGEYDSNEGPIEDTVATIFDLFIAMILIVTGIFGILAMAMRVHPTTHITTMDLLYTATEPYRERILEAIQLMIIVLLFTFMLYMYLLFISGT